MLVKKVKKLKKIENWVKKFDDIGVICEEQKNNSHYKIRLKTVVFDLWPTTGKWIGNGKKGDTLESLIVEVKTAIKEDKHEN